jgi:hypothetical protein
MADVTTNINGQQVTLTDNGDGTYRIDLSTQAARAFIRDGELQQLRDERDAKVIERNQAVANIQKALAQRDGYIAQRDALNAEITALNTNIQELVAWLQGQGDVP